MTALHWVTYATLLFLGVATWKVVRWGAVYLHARHNRRRGDQS